MKLAFHPEAKQEIRAARRYYERRVRGLGSAFLEEVERAIEWILDSPQTYPIISGQVRRFLLKRFPFAILYRIDADQILVLAVMHLRRDPDYWKHRGQHSSG